MSRSQWLDQKTLEHLIVSTRNRIQRLDWRASEEERYLWVVTLDLLLDLREEFETPDRRRAEHLAEEFEGLMQELARFGSS